MKLLVVDREGANRRMVVSALGACGHDVTESETGSVALELLARGHYDGVITEIDVGETSGIDVLRTVRGDPRYKSLGVILLTHPMDIEELRAPSPPASPATSPSRWIWRRSRCRSRT